MIAFFTIAGVLALIAFGCAAGIAHWLLKAFTMSRWPTVNGTITSSWDMLDGERLRYAYEVGKRRYVGHLVALSGGRTTFDDTPQELVEKYPPGAEVTVYYNPKHCATAVLEPRSMKSAAISLLFMVVFAAFAFIFFAVALRAP